MKKPMFFSVEGRDQFKAWCKNVGEEGIDQLTKMINEIKAGPEDSADNESKK